MNYLESKRTYADVLKYTGITEAEAWEISKREDDLRPFPLGFSGVEIKDSPIHGKGVFTTKDFLTGEFLALARADGNRTPAGRYCNHSGDPNAEMYLTPDGAVGLFALRNIGEGEEILADSYLNLLQSQQIAEKAQKEPLQELAEGGHSPEKMRSLILAFEDKLRGMTEIHIEIETTHYFAPGIYMRQVLIPKGATVTGKIHRTEHMNILSQGKLIVYTEDGMKELTASTVMKSQPGIKRVGHALEDSVWITVHANVTNEKDTDKIENMLIAPSFEALGIETKKTMGVE